MPKWCDAFTHSGHQHARDRASLPSIHRLGLFRKRREGVLPLLGKAATLENPRKEVVERIDADLIIKRTLQHLNRGKNSQNYWETIQSSQHRGHLWHCPTDEELKNNRAAEVLLENWGRNRQFGSALAQQGHQEQQQDAAGAVEGYQPDWGKVELQ